MPNKSLCPAAEREVAEALAYLRLAIAAGCDVKVIRLIFDRLWTTGVDPADPGLLDELLKSLNVDRARLSAPEVKETLRADTERAAAAGVFGVPTLQIDGQIFWGADAIGFARAYLDDPGILRTAEMQRVASLPIGAARSPAAQPGS